MKEEKSKGVAYALNILLFNLGLGWFYIGRHIEGIVHVVLGIPLSVGIIRLVFLYIISSYLPGTDSSPDTLTNILEHCPVTVILGLIYILWFVIDQFFLNDAIDQYNEKIKLENNLWLKVVSDNNMAANHCLATNVDERVDVQDEVLKNVIHKAYQSTLFQDVKQSYFKLTSDIQNKKLKRSYQLLEDGQYEIALKYFEDLLVDEEESSFIYLGRALANLEINTPEKMLLYYESLQKNNDFRRGEYIEDKGHAFYQLFNQLVTKVQKQYKATVTYNEVMKKENQLNYDVIMEKLLPYKDELDPKIFQSLKEKREKAYDEAETLVTEVNNKKASMYYQLALRNYRWCGHYKEAEQKIDTVTKQYEASLVIEKKRRVKKYSIISGTSVLVIATITIVSIVIYQNQREKAAVESLDQLKNDEAYVVREFCRENKIDPKDFIGYVNTYEYDDGDNGTIDIAYDAVKKTKLEKEDSIESGEETYYFAPSNSGVWHATSESE